MHKSTRANAMRDLRVILAAAKVKPGTVVDDPDLGLCISPGVVRPLVRRVWCYRRPGALLAVLRACERRWRRLHGHTAAGVP